MAGTTTDDTAGLPGQPPLIVVLSERRYLFPVGSTVRVGRSPDLEVVSTSPLVSRACHAVISVDAHGATYVDRSRRGTFLDGRPLRKPLRITESVELRLGDPVTGEVLGITPPLTSRQLEHNRRRRTRLRRGGVTAAVLGGLAVAAAVATVALLPGSSPATRGVTAARPSTAPQQRPSAVPLAQAQAATVRLLLGAPGTAAGWGSGTVVDPHGLILTNAHVAAPQAAGQAVALGVPGSQLASDPDFLTVEMTTGQSSPAVARYRARPVAVDGYLDLAVVRIYADAFGRPVDPGTLRLPVLDLGDSASLQLGEPLTVLGFPGVAESDSITVTDGVLSTFVPDPLHHVGDPRFELETTARVAHGNSGGAAVDAAGRLIGVPSLEVTGQGGDVSWRLRAAALARPLIAAARAGTPYTSTVLVGARPGEHVSGMGVGLSSGAACAQNAAGTLTGGPPATLWIGVRYGSLPVGLDVGLGVRLPDGTTVSGSPGGLPESTVRTSDGCLAVAVDAATLGLTALPVGEYQAQLFAGPNLDPVGDTARFRVGA
ncbi:trypsin-like peptidase domain-containing protein [Streptacidiphilus rugosus]|uniref:trypsin-like peptidase domain-containing protein n=1 Tax=Streptacidiphilus rugosus TaxID=405783 RepID=UPI000ABFD501|nr:trypsin-like peptidase domain-containing protein [Streptacidiphilus rugosus]